MKSLGCLPTTEMKIHETWGKRLFRGLLKIQEDEYVIPSCPQCMRKDGNRNMKSSQTGIGNHK